MKYKAFVFIASIALLVALLAGAIIVPARTTRAAGAAPHHEANPRAASASQVNATIYLTTPTLESLFQQNMAQQAPASFNSAINNAVSKLPAKDRGWVQQMIAALIQPSASLTGLTTQKNGLATSVRITLYSGDPQPINASMLVTFQVINSSTVQVSAQAINGSPALATGPLATFQIPIGQLQAINTTPGCGSAALAVHLQIPVTLGKGQATAQIATGQSGQNTPSNVPVGTNTYIEIPASSLAQLGGSIGTMPISGGLTAQNIQVGVQGSNLVITSDVYDSFFGEIGTAQTVMTPTARNGALAVTVTSTTFTLFGIIPIPENSYNQQIQQTMNSKLNSAFAGKFYLTQAQIGPNGGLPCAAGNSLVMSGSSSIG